MITVLNVISNRASRIVLMGLITLSYTGAIFAESSAKKAESIKAEPTSFKVASLSLTQNGDPEEPNKDFKWTSENIQLAVGGDAKLGKVLAKKGKCNKCHGDTGISDEDDTPSIAGQISPYAYKQLHDYKEGLRDSKEMLKKVRKLSSKDMADISAWYATQKREEMLGATDKSLIPLLATEGDEDRFILGCNTCHNEDAMNRGYQIPILEGQKIEYFKETMLAYKEGDRENDRYNLMRGISEKLTEEEIDRLAEYYSAKPLEDD